MEIVSWSPKVTARGSGADFVIDPALRFNGRLRCPICSHVEAVETSGHLLCGLATIKMNIDWEFDDFTKRRGCRNCGVVSAVPKANRDNLYSQASKLVTLDWVRGRVETLKQSARKRLLGG